MSGKQKKKKGTSDDDPLDLVDIGGQEHAIEVIREWATCAPADYQEQEAETIERLLVGPLWRWIGQQGEGAERRIDVRAAVDLATYAAEDIAYSFRYRQKLYPEQVNKLDGLWREFQRVVGVGSAMCEQRKRTELSGRQSLAASQKRKAAVTKEALAKFKDNFEARYGTSRGWKKAACAEFKIDNKTLNTRISRE
jgi:hypothetical protein